MEIMFTEPMVRTLMRLAYSEGVQGCEELGDQAVADILQEVVGLPAEAKPAPPPQAAPRAAAYGANQNYNQDEEEFIPPAYNQRPMAQNRPPRQQQPAGIPANRPRGRQNLGYPDDDGLALQQRADPGPPPEAPDWEPLDDIALMEEPPPAFNGPEAG